MLVVRLFHGRVSYLAEISAAEGLALYKPGDAVPEAAVHFVTLLKTSPIETCKYCTAQLDIRLLRNHCDLDRIPLHRGHLFHGAKACDWIFYIPSS